MSRLVHPYDPRWPRQFAAEADRLREVFGASARRIEHIGSTSVPGMLAKPVIDILVELDRLDAADAAAEALTRRGYDVMGENGIQGRRYFRRRDAAGNRACHVHAFRSGDAHLHRHLAFRDFLRAHPGKARAYSDLKAQLTAKGDIERKAYQAAKSAFVSELEAEALIWAKTR